MPPLFLGLKLLNVFGIGCIGSGMLLLPMFYKNELGLGTDEIGLIYSITPFVSCLSLPFWTGLADRTKRYKKIMMINMTIALISMLFIGLVPRIASKEQTVIALISLGNFSYAFFGYPVIAAMVDCVTMQVLADQKTLYGRQKAGFPIGVGSSIFFSGLLTDWYGQYALFGVHAFFALSFILTIALTDFRPYNFRTGKLPSLNNASSDYGAITTIPHKATFAAVAIEDTSAVQATGTARIPNNSPSKQSMLDLLTPEVVQFLVTMAILGIVVVVMQVYLYIFIINDLHGTPFMVGLTGPLASSTEVVCFYFSKEVSYKKRSRAWLMSFVDIPLARSEGDANLRSGDLHFPVRHLHSLSAPISIWCLAYNNNTADTWCRFLTTLECGCRAGRHDRIRGTQGPSPRPVKHGLQWIWRWIWVVTGRLHLRASWCTSHVDVGPSAASFWSVSVFHVYFAEVSSPLHTLKHIVQ